VTGVLPVDDPTDPRLRDYLDLTDVALRRRREPADGLFMAEGEKVIRRALAAGYRMRSLLLEDKWLASLRDVVDAFDGPVYVGARPVLAKVTGYDVHRGALAAMNRRPLPSVHEVLAGARRVVVLENLTDHTNVGAIFRSAAGLGMDAVLVTPRCADPLYRRSVKVSMGAVFSVPWTRLGSWPGDLALLRQAELAVLALTPEASAVPIDELAPEVRARAALVLGAEGPGLAPRTLAEVGTRVRIPMAAGVDSLNVGAAAAVAFYALTR
jgi:tRNA G18 (ribose-2'-O)-methylase SpoU